jgi:hypothetical protein
MGQSVTPFGTTRKPWPVMPKIDGPHGDVTQHMWSISHLNTPFLMLVY